MVTPEKKTHVVGEYPEEEESLPDAENDLMQWEPERKRASILEEPKKIEQPNQMEKLERMRQKEKDERRAREVREEQGKKADDSDLLVSEEGYEKVERHDLEDTRERGSQSPKKPSRNPEPQKKNEKERFEESLMRQKERLKKIEDVGRETIKPKAPPKVALDSAAEDDKKTSRESKLEEQLTIHSTLEQACSTAAKFEESQKECEVLREQVISLRKELSDAHNFIFSLQPRREQITESEAATEFKSLYASVEEWVETKLGDDIMEAMIKKVRPSAKPARNFINFTTHAGQEATGCSGTDEYNVITMIMNFLCVEIFDKDFYCPIEDGGMEFLTSILTSMRNLEPRRDMATWRHWRSELYTALANRHEFADQRQRASARLVSELTNMLAIFVPEADKKVLGASVKTTIIEPALNLAHKLHLSVNKFSLEWSHFMRTRPEERPLDPKYFLPFECVDLARSGKVLKPQAFENSGPITYLFDLSPALVFEAVKADSFAEPKVLKRQRILVVASKEGQSRFIVPRVEFVECPTLVGWLLYKLHNKYFF
ncbi:hypothetical protein G7Y89_g1185 [Cudoniella acicularis]|uniref:Uncharacterized protein n=1 Tax=Cudoniella acicularis TaxID=354080 RepID=A0A8H4W862_9HELO|nr:hypothetical protein G7Y89_g1185 [Cudoniella acicularis]